MDPGLRLADWAGRLVPVAIDRPLGSRHPREPDLIYEVNYGFVPGTMAPDGHPTMSTSSAQTRPSMRSRPR
ncbi:MAG: hypothetical protein O2798_02380 [Chloroflexi bacterium]|nr:hypothetical protein [Chloroflexota bacterium]MDA1239669.1 hypothetical protein [Chloroflexota bacterium]